MVAHLKEGLKKLTNLKLYNEKGKTIRVFQFILIYDMNMSPAKSKIDSMYCRFLGRKLLKITNIAILLFFTDHVIKLKIVTIR